MLISVLLLLLKLTLVIFQNCIFKVRECNGIELIMDCSPLDIRNPVITQWVVVAVRYLCENNLENQNVIAKLDTKGVMDKSGLSKSGLDIHGFE